MVKTGSKWRALVVAALTGVGTADMGVVNGLVAYLLPARASQAHTAADEARRVLARARASLGGDRLTHVAALVLRGTAQRPVRMADGESQLSSELEVQIRLPDKYFRREAISLGAGVVTRGEGFDGAELLTDPQQGVRGAARRPDAGEPAAVAATVRRLRLDAARLIVGLLVSSPMLPATFTYAGQARSPDGAAEVIDITGEDGFAARLFIDGVTSRPLMLTYRAPPLPGPVVGLGLPANGIPPSREAIRRLREEVETQIKLAASAPLRMVEARIYFSDHRQVDGVLLPFRVSREVGGTMAEEWDVREYVVNPPARPEGVARE